MPLLDLLTKEATGMEAETTAFMERFEAMWRSPTPEGRCRVLRSEHRRIAPPTRIVNGTRERRL
jgi:hypothetical protein